METQELIEKSVLKVVRTTEKAWLLKLSSVSGKKSKDIWFPKSVCKLVTKNKKRVVMIPKWLWVKKEEEINLPF